MSDNGVSGRATTAVLLANDRSPEVLAALKEALTDKDASVRAAVVHALALRNDPSMLPLMKEQFDDASESRPPARRRGLFEAGLAEEATTGA